MEWVQVEVAALDEAIAESTLASIRMDLIADAIVLGFWRSSTASSLRESELDCPHVLVAVAPVFRLDVGLGGGRSVFSGAIVHSADVSECEGHLMLKLDMLVPTDSFGVEIIGDRVVVAVRDMQHLRADGGYGEDGMRHGSANAVGVALLAELLRDMLPLAPA